MLAWAHSATVSEREALEALFISDGDEIARSIQAGIESEPWSRGDERENDALFDGRKTLNQLVERDLTDVFRQLKQRTEQVVRSQEDAALSYKIANLSMFYSSIFAKLLGEHSGLLDMMRPLSEMAMRSFKATMRDHVANLQAEATIIPDDLKPPDFLTEALDTLQILMKSYDTSPTTMDRAKRIEGFQPILGEALDPFLAGCENITKRLRTPKDHIFGLNCLLTTTETLRKYPFVDRGEELRPKIDDHEKGLTSATHQWFLRESGLATLTEHIKVRNDLSSSYYDATQLASVAERLDAFLPAATDDARSFLSQLEDKTLARSIIENAAERFCEDFEKIEALIVQADEMRTGQANGDLEGGVWLREIFPRTGDEIRVLLS